jgi:hypothetical protein
MPSATYRCSAPPSPLSSPAEPGRAGLPREAGIHSIPDRVIHRSRLQVTAARRLRRCLAACPRVLAQAAASAEDACGWITRGLGRRLTTQDRLTIALSRRQWVRFRAELSEVLSADFAGVHSLLEYRYVKWVEVPHGLPRGKRQVPAVRDGRREYRNVLYDEYSLIVEIDGRAAHPGDARWNDIRRDNAAAGSGRMTLRYGWDDLRLHPCDVAEQVYRALSRSAPVQARPCSPTCPVTRKEH